MSKSKSINFAKKIHSRFIIRLIFSYLNEKKELEIVKYNKELKTKLDIGIYKYIFYQIYSKSKLIDSKDKIIIDFNDNKNQNSLYNLIDKKIKNMKRKQQILTNFFNDIFKRNPDIYINYFTNNDSYSLNQFKFLISFNPIIKIILQIDLSCFILENRNDKDYKTKIQILQIIDKKDIIFGIDFGLNSPPKEERSFQNNILNIINNAIKKVKYIKLPCKLIIDLINKQYLSFFENNFLKFEIYIDNINYFSFFLSIFIEIIQFYLETEELIIKNGNLYYDLYNFRKANLNISEIKSLKKLVLYNLGCQFEFESETTKRLFLLDVSNVSVHYSSKLVKFSNLNTLIIKDTCLGEILNIKKIDFKSFSNLECLIIDIHCLSCLIILNELIKYSLNLIEFDISYAFEEKYANRELIEEEIDEYNLNLNSCDDNEEESEDDETNIFKKYKLILKKMQLQLFDNLIKLENIKILRINDFESDSVFTSGLLDEYENENLVEFQSNCISLSNAKNFIENHPYIKTFEFSGS